jgi:hypothetical protein
LEVLVLEVHMPLYEVLLEAVNGTVARYEICTPDFDAVDLALLDLGKRLPEQTTIHVGGYSQIGEGFDSSLSMEILRV